MASFYFATTKTGYIQKTIEGVPKAVTGKQIPVYKRVSQFMNLPAKEEDKSIIKEVDEETEYFQPLKSTRSLDVAIFRIDNPALVRSAHMHSTVQGEFVNEEDVTNSLIKQKQFSSKETSASQVNFPSRKKLKVNIIESEEGNNEEDEQLFDRNELEKEIEKERTLRKNLENSYFNLLRKIKTEKEALSTHFNDSQVYKNRDEESQQYHQDQNQQNQESRETNYDYRCHRRTNSVTSEQFPKSQASDNHSLPKSQIDMMESLYKKQLKRQKVFQRKLMSQIRDANCKLEILQDNFLKREIEIQTIIKERDQLKALQYNPTQSNAIHKENAGRNKDNKSLKHQVHYIFTVFVMFLIIAMISKNGQK